jgi:disulfide bond formation protein DsbB
LTAAFLIALAATLGALFIGEVLGQMPCTLCWYQRIAMFPLGADPWPVALAGGRHGAHLRLAAGLAGLALAAWHSGLYAGILPAPIVPCTENGPSCTGEAQMILGLPIPYLSAVAFAAILACLLLPKGHRP